MASGLCDPSVGFECSIVNIEGLETHDRFDIVILPPSLKGEYYQQPSKKLLNWLAFQQDHKAILCSACSGAFILAKGGFTKDKKVTTHWALADTFNHLYPDVDLDSNQILINEGNIITAGGVMSWLDLGLELVAQNAGPGVMMQLGKNLVVDTGHRAQSYYEQFFPKRNHADEVVLKAQDYIDQHYTSRIKTSDLAELGHMTERSFLRRFQRELNLTPTDYLQRLRIQKACELLESSKKSFEAISVEVGYENSSACRKIFVRIIGITPKQFRQRFVKG